MSSKVSSNQMITEFSSSYSSTSCLICRFPSRAASNISWISRLSRKEGVPSFTWSSNPLSDPSVKATFTDARFGITNSSEGFCLDLMLLIWERVLWMELVFLNMSSIWFFASIIFSNKSSFCRGVCLDPLVLLLLMDLAGWRCVVILFSIYAGSGSLV